jgi:hypothetical protein
MEGYGLVRLERGARGRIAPRVIHDRVELDLPLAASRKASRGSPLPLGERGRGRGDGAPSVGNAARPRLSTAASPLRGAAHHPWRISPRGEGKVRSLEKNETRTYIHAPFSSFGCTGARRRRQEVSLGRMRPLRSAETVEMRRLRGRAGSRRCGFTAPRCPGLVPECPGPDRECLRMRTNADIPLPPPPLPRSEGNAWLGRPAWPDLMLFRGDSVRSRAGAAAVSRAARCRQEPRSEGREVHKSRQKSTEADTVENVGFCRLLSAFVGFRRLSSASSSSAAGDGEDSLRRRMRASRL